MEYKFSDHFFHNPESINSNVNDGDGVYLIGHYDDSKTRMIVTYVGRGNLKNRLKVHLNDSYKDELFKVLYTDDDNIAMDLECEYYHKFKKTLKNQEHPKTDGEKCKYCDHNK